MKLSYTFLAFLLLCVPVWAAESSVTKPNIILIISDDQGFFDYGFMSHPVAKTPNLDRIAAQGLLYTRGYTMPLCSPSLACLLTGKLPHQNGITGNDLAAAESPAERRKSKGNVTGKRGPRGPLLDQLLSNSLILPKALTDAGYLAFQTGKLWNVTYKDVGFTSGMTVDASRHGDQGLTIGRQGMQPIFDFIDSARKEKKPFFVWYAPMMPHTPHTPPAELLARYQGKGLTPAAEKYYAMVEWFDQTCGELDDYLVKNKLADNTIILFLADNGWNANEGLGPTARAKLTPYELGIRTPMFVRWPSKVKPQRDDQTLASVIDFAPTILKAAGVQGATDLPGIDLLDREAMTARKSIFVESYTHNIAELGAPSKSLVARVIVDGWSKLIIPGTAKDSKRVAAPSEVELFDLQSDPMERTNLAPNRPEDVKRLEAIQQSAWKL